jgi:hypothetical protein
MVSWMMGHFEAVLHVVDRSVSVFSFCATVNESGDSGSATLQGSSSVSHSVFSGCLGAFWALFVAPFVLFASAWSSWAMIGAMIGYIGGCGIPSLHGLNMDGYGPSTDVQL